MTATLRQVTGAAIVFACAAGVWAQGSDAWIKGSIDPDDFEMGVDLPGPLASGPPAVHLKSMTPHPAMFGTLRQHMSSEFSRGGRLRLSAAVKAEGVTGWAGLWMRVDGKPRGSTPRETLAFDNMCGRPILDFSDWTTYEIVLDVSKDANQIAYGILLAPTGPSRKKPPKGSAAPPAAPSPSIGEVWIKDVHFDLVDKKVEVTGGSGVSSGASCPGWARFQ